MRNALSHVGVIYLIYFQLIPASLILDRLFQETVISYQKLIGDFKIKNWSIWFIVIVWNGVGYFWL